MQQTRAASSRTAVRLLAAAAAACALLSALGGCGPRNFANENDRLRARVQELERDVKRARDEAGEYRAKLGESERARAGAISEDALAALPRAARIEVERLSGLIDRDGIPGPEAADVYIQPRDARSRFVPVAGRLTIEILELPPAGSGESPRRLGGARLDPAALRDAFRSSFLTLNYTVRVPLDEPNRPVTGDVLIRAELVDGVTGLTHAHELLRPAARSGDLLGDAR